MSLYDIDHAATQARLDAITAGGVRALGECARRSAEIDKQVQEMHARQERQRQAGDVRATQIRPEPPRPQRPATLALGGEEFREARQPGPPRPALPPRLAHGPAATRQENRERLLPKGGPATPEPLRRRTLRFGAPEDREQQRPPGNQPPPELEPKLRRPPTDGDDDMSGRTWLR